MGCVLICSQLEAWLSNSGVSLQCLRFKESFARDPPKCEKLLQSNVLCIDFLGSLLEGAGLEVQLRKLVDGVQVRGLYALFRISNFVHVCHHDKLCLLSCVSIVTAPCNRN